MKLVLIDGNNLLFRSYYATAYSGSMMQNSKGFPTNALYGFLNMINKIISEEKPEYILVSLDKGKTFRHDNFKDYKAGRQETPNELKMQIEESRKLLDAMGIKWQDSPGYEADDIIGTIAKEAYEDNFETLIISSDRDLLQLINDKTKVKLLKSKDYILMDELEFVSQYAIDPIRVIDLKGLQGDASDNIPGVKGIGEKTALKLLQEYDTIENIYVNIDKIQGKLKEKLLDSKDSAFLSKQLATIYKDVPLDITVEDTKYKGPNIIELKKLYEELEFYSLLKNIESVKKEETIESFEIIENIESIRINSPFAFYLEIDGNNYHTSNVLGMAIYNKEIKAFIPEHALRNIEAFFPNIEKCTYDLKKHIVALKKYNINLENVSFDSMVAAHILNYNVKDDIAYLSNQLGVDLPFFEVITKAKEKNNENIMKLCINKAKFIYESKDKLYKEFEPNNDLKLFKELEMPLIEVLADMEYTGIKIDRKTLEEMADEIKLKLELLSKDIYNYAGEEFNINSYKQLGTILFDKLKIPSNKKRSTDRDYLIKFKNAYPIIPIILEYKLLSKIYSTYTVGLQNYILKDNKIHNMYTQTLTKTGRLSSIEPNLQNIPIRYEYGKLVRKAFLPDNDTLMSVDYSQIELRVFAHFSKEHNLIEAFRSGIDIHTKTAMDIFKVGMNEVNSEMRRQAKAVNFGILYGISSFGLSENLDVDIIDAKDFIDKYLETFPGIKQYMENVIEHAHKLGYVKTLMGRKRIIEELNNKNYMIRNSGERMALNTPIQGSSAEIIKTAMIEIYKEIEKRNYKSKMLIQVHDELIFDVVKEEKEEFEKLVVNIMENCFKLDVPLKVEVSYGKNWYECK